MDETSIEDPQGLHQVSSLLRFSSSFFFFLFLFHVSSRCCGPLCFHLLGNRHQHNSVEFECSIQLGVYFLWKSQKERRKKVKETSEPVQTLIDGHSRYRSCALSYSLRLSLLIVTSARIHNIYCIPVVEIPGPFGHCRLQWMANFSWSNSTDIQ